MSEPEAGEKKAVGHKAHDPRQVLIVTIAVLVLGALAIKGEWMPPQYLFGLILAGSLGVLALEKVNKVIVVMVGAGVALLLGVMLDANLVESGHVGHFHVRKYIAMIEWGTIGIIIGSTIFVELISRSGLFTWSAVRLLKLSKGDPLKLLAWFSVLTVVFSAFLNNVTAMIIVGSLTVVACRRLGLAVMPFLITEGIFTNIGGLLTLISSIPNIIVGTQADISYGKFFIVAAPYCLVSFFATLWMMSRQFGIKSLKTPEEKAEAQAMVDRFDEWETVKDRKFFYTSGGVLGLIIIAFAFHAQLPIIQHMGLEVVAFIGATLMLVLYPTDVEEVLDRVEWSLVFFFVGLFALLGVMEEAGVLKMIGDMLAGPLGAGKVVGPVALLWASAFFSGLTDNIPLSAVLAKVLAGMEGGAAMTSYGDMLWWSLIFGAGLGGNFTPIGSASTVVALMILKKEGIKISFMKYIKLAVLVVIMQLALATGYLFLADALGMLG